MKADPNTVRHLNTVLRNELTAINQYFLHASMLKDWGVLELAEFERKESLEEMQHAEWLIERILFLEGLPNLQDLGKLRVGESVEEILRCDLAMEMEATEDLRAAVGHCESVSDYVSRDLFRRILDSEEEHIDYLETQISLIDRIGIKNYTELRARSSKA